MAKKSVVARNEQRKVIVAKYAAKRKELKDTIHNKNSTPEEVQNACFELKKLPRDASPSRVKNRCTQTGRSRAYMGDFGLSRLEFRRLSHQGLIPGIKKASW